MFCRMLFVAGPLGVSVPPFPAVSFYDVTLFAKSVNCSQTSPNTYMKSVSSGWLAGKQTSCIGIQWAA